MNPFTPEQDPRLYVRIRAQLARKSGTAEYPAGAKLPTEAELAAQHGCDPDRAQKAWPAPGSGRPGGAGARQRLLLPVRSRAMEDEDGIPGRPRERRLPGALTSNALLTGVVCVVLAGLISFFVARWQAQDATRQAASAQQVTAIVRLEAAANTFYQGTLTLLGSCYKKPDLCPNGAYQSPWITYQAAFDADRANVSDPQTAMLAGQVSYDADTAIEYAGIGSDPAAPWFNRLAVHTRR